MPIHRVNNCEHRCIHELSRRDCPKKVCRVAIRYSSTHEKDAPNRPIRPRVGVYRASPTCSEGCREAQDAPLTRDPRQPSSTWCVVAALGACCRMSFRLGRLSTTLLQNLAHRRYLAEATRRPVRAFTSTPQEGPSTEQRGYSGQPVSEDHRGRWSTARIRTRRQEIGHSWKPAFIRPHTKPVPGRRQASLFSELPRRGLLGN
jgi:hypothetical protein